MSFLFAATAGEVTNVIATAMATSNCKPTNPFTLIQIVVRLIDISHMTTAATPLGV